MPRWLNPANLVTLLRLLLVPGIIQAIFTGRHSLALSLFATAALTDVVDGALARRFGMATQTGAYLDPIADKCLLSGVFLSLAVTHMVPWWAVAVILGRDIYILGAVIAVMLFTSVRKFPPSAWGKASTFVQISTVVLWMSRDVLELPVLDELCAAMLWLCVAFAAVSALHYTWRGWHALRVR